MRTSFETDECKCKYSLFLLLSVGLHQLLSEIATSLAAKSSLFLHQLAVNHVRLTFSANSQQI